MTVVGSYTYIIFPISTLIWGIYKFFKDDDDDYCRINGIKRGLDAGWLLGFDDIDGENYRYYDNNHKTQTKNNKTTTLYQNPEYKRIIPRCRRNYLVSIDKVKRK